MNCQQCGKQVDQGAAFCGNCGAPFAQSQAAPQVPQSVQPMAVAPAPVAAQPAPQPAQPQPFMSPQASQPVAQPANAQPLPPYAVLVPGAGASSTKAIVGLVLGILALPGCIVPILGLGFSIAAIVLGSMAMKVKKTMAVAAVVLGIIGCLLALMVFTVNLNTVMKNKKNGTYSSSWVWQPVQP